MDVVVVVCGGVDGLSCETVAVSMETETPSHR